jgi:hypothetical protein
VGKFSVIKRGTLRTFPLILLRLTPDVLWAQRSDTVLLTINLQDIRNEKLSLEQNSFTFTGNGGSEGKLYSLNMAFHKEVVPQVC